MHQLELSAEQAERLMPLIAEFKRSVERERKLDADLARILRNPGSETRRIVKQIIQQELAQ